ncbi:MAG: hypothetical protein VXW38_08325 [Bacteroidota bacterium]|nr:hypothetical protein [Bacteroidota bacterium]
MKISIDIGSISEKKGKVFGNVYFHENSFFFPEKGWNDFLVIVLNWWCHATKKLISNESIHEDFSFMDGPFQVRIGYFKDGFFNLTFKSNEDVLRIVEVPISSFLNDFLGEINMVLRHFHHLKWNDKETEELNKNYKEIKLLLKNHQADNVVK